MMSRMFSYPSSYMRNASYAAIFVITIACIGLFSPNAYADPHAVFYTDRAQEQLFYNTLAALNQADFVEPVTGQFSRAEILRNRENADQQNPQPPVSPDPSIFDDEQNPLVTSTRTQLPAILNRSITLGGNDLWTSYLVHQFALETDIRRSASRLIRDFCTNGLGIVGCDIESPSAQQQSTTFPTDINRYTGSANLTLTGAVSSGTTEEDAFQDKITGKDTTSSSGNASTEPGVPEYLKFPRGNSSAIAGLRKNNENNPQALNVVNQTAASVISAQYPSGPDPHAFDKVEFSNDGKKVEVADDITFDEYLNAVSGIGGILPGTIAVAQQGREQGEAFKAYKEQTPSLAQYSLTKDEGGGVKGTLTVPSTAISAQIEQGVALLQNQSVNQQTAASTEISIPGLTPSLTREELRIPEVSGISTKNLPEGEVKGVVSFANAIYNLYDAYYRKPTNTTNNPSTGLIPPFEETGNAQFLQAIGGKNSTVDKETAECGFCTALGKILNNSTVISDYAEQIYTDLYCFFFPTTEYCVKKKLDADTL